MSPSSILQPPTLSTPYPSHPHPYSLAFESTPSMLPAPPPLVPLWASLPLTSHQPSQASHPRDRTP